MHLCDGSSVTGELARASANELELKSADGTRVFRVGDIQRVAQEAPVDLKEPEKAECLKAIVAQYKNLPSPNEGQKLVKITLTNHSKYTFRGTIQLTAYDSDGDATGKDTIDLASGLPPGGVTTRTVMFRTFRKVAQLSRVNEGQFRAVVEVVPTE